MDDKHLCGKCKKDFDILYGFKAYEMRSNDEFYCKSCFKRVHGVDYDEVGNVSDKIEEL